jgi:hypothetical protein
MKSEECASEVGSMGKPVCYPIGRQKGLMRAYTCAFAKETGDGR